MKVVVRIFISLQTHKFDFRCCVCGSADGSLGMHRYKLGKIFVIKLFSIFEYPFVERLNCAL